MAKYKLTNFIKESHPANDQWLEAFHDALGMNPMISTSYLIDKYGHMKPEEAAKQFMDDATASQMAKDKEKFSKETGLEEDEFKFRPTETDAPGMQARPDGYLKEKSEVEESLDYQHLMKVRAGIIK